MDFNSNSCLIISNIYWPIYMTTYLPLYLPAYLLATYNVFTYLSSNLTSGYLHIYIPHYNIIIGGETYLDIYLVTYFTFPINQHKWKSGRWRIFVEKICGITNKHEQIMSYYFLVLMRISNQYSAVFYTSSRLLHIINQIHKIIVIWPS